MKTDVERKFELLIKDMVDNTDFEDDLNSKIKEAELDRIPEFEFLKGKKASSTDRFRKANSRFIKVAGFVFAVFAVSSIMTITINSDLVEAGKFQLNNFIFSIKNGFLTSDIQLNETPTGRELLIEEEGQISIGQDYLEELKVPKFIPNGYTFSCLQITNNPKNEYVVMYIFENDMNEIIRVTQEKLADYNRDINMVGIKDEFYVDETHIFYIPDIVSEYRTIHAFSEFEVVRISGHLELTDLIEVFEGFQ